MLKLGVLTFFMCKVQVCVNPILGKTEIEILRTVIDLFNLYFYDFLKMVTVIS